MREQLKTIEPQYNAVVVQLVRIHDSENGKPQYAKMFHIECKDADMLDKLQELARELQLNNRQ